MKADIQKRFYLTVVTRSEKPHHQTFWFGRADMKDNLRPIKVEAKNGKEAWEILEAHEGSK